MVLAAAARQDGKMATTVTEGEPRGLRMPSATLMRWRRKLATFAEPRAFRSWPARDVRFCAGFWTPATMKDPRTQLAGVQKAPRHEVGHRLSSGRYDLMSAPLSMVSATPKIVQRASRRGVKCSNGRRLIDGYGFERRQPGRTLPQLPRFGVRVARKYF